MVIVLTSTVNVTVGEFHLLSPVLFIFYLYLICNKHSVVMFSEHADFDIVIFFLSGYSSEVCRAIKIKFYQNTFVLAKR